MKTEMEQMRLQFELSMHIVETASTSSTTEIKNTITGFQNEITVEKVQRESDFRRDYDLIQQLQQKQNDTEESAISLKIAL